MKTQINPANRSKILITQAVAAVGLGLTFFGLDLDAQTQSQIVTAIASGNLALTSIFRMWHTKP